MLKKTPPGFSERVYEFAFNAEFARLNAAVLASLPWMPTTQEEKLLGYDVRFRIKTGATVKSIFLQHKVASRFVLTPKTANTSSKYVPTMGHDFFRFKIDNSQYNKIVNLRSKGQAAYYCAPMFTGSRRLSTRFMAGAVGLDSVWIDVKQCGLLTGAALTTGHHLAYTPALVAYRFSDVPFQAVVRRGAEEALANIEAMHFLPSSLRDLLAALHKSCDGQDRAYSRRLVLPGRDVDMPELIARISRLAREEFGLDWYLVPLEKVAA